MSTDNIHSETIALPCKHLQNTLAKMRIKPPSRLAEYARTGRIELVEELLRAGANPNEPETARHWSPLIEAAYGNHAEIARLLLEAGSELYCKTNAGASVLTVAFQQKSFDVVQVLRDRGYQPDANRDGGAELIHFAAKYVELVRWLANAGVNVNGSRDAWSPLTQAANFGHYALAAELISLGARPSVGALIGAISSNQLQPNTALAKMLIEEGADVNAALFEVVRIGWVTITDRLLKLGANPNVTDPRGHSVLYVAQTELEFRSYIPEIVRCLKEHGAELNELDLIESEKSPRAYSDR